MANSIDQLSIEITAQTRKANKAIDDLCSKLNKLSRSINGVNVTKFTAKMNKMSTALRRVAKDSKSIGKDTGDGFNNLSYSFQNLGNGLTKINSKINSFFANLKKGNTQTKNFAQTVGMLYARFFLLIRGLKLFGSAIKSSMNYLETLNYFNASFKQVADKAVGEWEQAGYDSAEAYYDSFSERAKKVTADMTGFYPDANGNLVETGMQSLGLNPNTLMNYQAQFAQMASSMGVASDNAMLLSEALTKIGADLASVKNMNFEDVWGDMASGLVGMSRTLDKYGVNIRNSAMQQKLAQLGIDATVSSLSQQDKALLRTIILLDSTRYAWGDLANTINTPANQIRLIKANIEQLGRIIGSIFLPAIQAILPYINAFIIALQRLFTWLARILGIDLSGITGGGGKDNSPLGDILDDLDDTNDELENADKNAKKLKRTILGFDELNVLQKPDDDNDKNKDKNKTSPSGLLNDAFKKALQEYLDAWQKAFEELENKAKEIADRIVAFIKRLFKPILKAFQDWGGFIKEQWKRAIREIGKLFSDVGRDFWKVWETPETQAIFDNIAKMIGQIGTIIGNLAIKVREAWNANDSGLRILTAIRDIIAVIVQHMENITLSLVKWTRDLNLEPLFDKIAGFMEALVPVFDAIYGVFEDFVIDVLEPLAKWVLEKGLPDLFQVLTDFVNKIDWDKLRSEFKQLWEHLEPFAERVGEGLIQFIKELSDKIAHWVNDGGFEKFIDKLSAWLDSVSADDVTNLLWNLVRALIAFKGAVAVFKVAEGLFTALKWLKDVGNLINGGGLVAGLEGLSVAILALGGAYAGFKFSEDAKAWLESVRKNGYDAGRREIAKNNKANPYRNGQAFFQEDDNYDEEFLKKKGLWGENGGSGFSRAQKGLKDVNDSLTKTQNTAIKLGDVFSTIGEKISSSVETNIKPKFTKEAWNNIYQPIKDAFEQKWNELVDWWNNTGFNSWIENSVKPWFTKEKWSEIYSNIKNSLEEKWGELTEWWQNTALAQWWDNNVAPWFTKDKWIELYTNIKAGLVEKWGELVEWWSNTAIVGWWDEHVAPWFTADKWLELYNNIKTSLESKWNELVDWWKSSALVKWWDEHVAPWFTKEKWSGIFINIKEALSEKWGETVENWKTSFGEWWNDVKIKFSKSKWVEILKDIKPAFRENFVGAFNEIKKEAEEMFNKIVGWIDDLLGKLKGLIDKIKEARSKSSSSSIGSSSSTSSSLGGLTGKKWDFTINIPKINLKLPKFANGGFPEDGFFFANHNELVGGFHGKTAVANNQQITDGIRSAVYDAMMSAMSSGMGNNLTVNAVLKTENDEVLARAVERGQQSLNRRYSAVY